MFLCKTFWMPAFFPAIRASTSSIDSLGKDGTNGVIVKASETSTRGRRPLKLREEKPRREQDRLHNTLFWGEQGGIIAKKKIVCANLLVPGN